MPDLPRISAVVARVADRHTNLSRYTITGAGKRDLQRASRALWIRSLTSWAMSTGALKKDDQVNEV